MTSNNARGKSFSKKSKKKKKNTNVSVLAFDASIPSLYGTTYGFLLELLRDYADNEYPAAA